MDMVVIQSYISLSELKKTKTKFLRHTGYLNAIKTYKAKFVVVFVVVVVVDFLFIVTPIVGVCNCSMFCCTLLYVHSSIAIILMGKRELVAMLNLSSWCLMMVERLFLAMPRGCLRFVIVVFTDHTHLLFLLQILVLVRQQNFLNSKPHVLQLLKTCYQVQWKGIWEIL